MIGIGVAILSVVMATVIHEVGHAVACLALGFTLQAFGTWPFSVRRTETSWRFSLSAFPRQAGGFVAALPRTTKYLRSRTILTLLAGPGASGAAAAICLRLRERSNFSLQMANMLGEVAVWSLLFAVFSLIPTTKRRGSDGRQIWDLLRSGKAFRRVCALSELLGVTSGLRPREWNPELVSLALSTSASDVSIPAPDLSLLLQWLKYNWCADTGRKSEAAQALRWLTSEQHGEFSRGAHWEAAWFEAFSNGDSAAARQHIQVAETLAANLFETSLRWKATAAVALLEGRVEEARQAAEKAITSLASEVASPGLKRAIKDDLQELLNRAAPSQLA